MDSLPGILEVEPDETSRPIYEQRVQMFLVDNEQGKEIEIELSGKRNTMRSSELNGHFNGNVYRNRNYISDQEDYNWG